MANGITGGITVSFGNHENFQLSEARVAKLMNNDLSKATEMGWWDTIKDFFNDHVKKEALTELHHLIHGDHESTPFGSISTFNQLKALANPVYRDQFHFTCENIHDPHVAGGMVMTIGFQVGEKVIHTESLQNILLHQLKFADGESMANPTTLINKALDYCLAYKKEFEIMYMDPVTKKPCLLTGIGTDDEAAAMSYWGLNNPDVRELMQFFDEIGFRMDMVTEVWGQAEDILGCNDETARMRLGMQNLACAAIEYSNGKEAIASDWDEIKTQCPTEELPEVFARLNISNQALWNNGFR